MLLFQRSARMPRARFLLLLSDIFFLMFFHGLAAWLRLGSGEWVTYSVEHVWALGFSVLIYILVYYAAGMYEVKPPHAGESALPFVSSLIAMAIIGVAFYAGPQEKIGRGVWLLASLLILVGSMTIRRGIQYVLTFSFLRRPALLIYDHPDLLTRILPFVQAQSFPYRVVGLANWTGQADESTSGLLNGLPVVCSVQNLEPYIQEQGIGGVLLAVSARKTHELLPFLRLVRYRGIDILDYLHLCETLLGEIPLDYIDEEWLMTVALNSSIMQVKNIKRCFDVLASFCGLMLGAPIMLICAVLIKCTSPGPILYRQKRAGLNGKVFTLYKLRSMRMDAESNGPVWAQLIDPRVTWVGYYLRKWRLDEVPQLVNILRGEMSLVGPRPERPEFTEMLAALIPFYKERLLLRPGLTGWAQVKYPYAASQSAAARKLQYDLFYMKNMGFWMDAMILLRTFKTILVGLRHESDQTMAQEEVISRTGDIP